MQKKFIYNFQFIVLLNVLLFFLNLGLYGAPLRGDEKRLKQPDGVYVSVKIWGDEFFMHIESLDGYTLVRDTGKGWIHYAFLNADSSALIPSG
ncbi:MAG: hypothetical protein IPO21_16150 [Bacteroidales bacterium]|nr:hypothetical protein [Bacteroidales bacterium]